MSEKKYNRFLLKVRAWFFWVPAFIVTIPYMLLVNLLIVLPYRTRYKLMRSWNYIILWWLKVTCGISFKVDGLENVPDYPVVVMAKHQSTFETVALTVMLPPMSWVIKRELLFIPVFGWALYIMNPIAIDRKAGRKAVSQIIEQGRKRFEEGTSVLVFPEGTRVKPGQTERYKKGGFILAQKTQTSILPIAHNAGDFWPKHSMIKWPGEITFSIGPVIEAKDKTSNELLLEAQTWIDGEANKLHIEKRFPY
jgi:1-acyl-sn-glycerol-3-phosphate acyltransferase